MKKINSNIPLIGLFLLLSLMALLLTMYSARIYDNIIKDSHKNNTAFITATYITEKIKQSSGPITINDNQMILQNNNIQTVIYLHENRLYETTIYADKELSPGTGEPLFEIRNMILKQTDNLLEITVIDDSGNIFTKRKVLYGQTSDTAAVLH